METTFTPLASALGGAAIGLGAVLLMLGLGRILGATGILSGLFLPETKNEMSWRIAMVLGMLISPGVYFWLTGALPQITIEVSPVMIALGGVIVGLGASLGSGCTSGHGVCGLSRLSLRSIVAVPTFMATGAVTVFLIRHVFGG